MNKFDKRQRSLVKKCEKAHEAGFRHKGLSGTICEDLLISTLRKDVKGLKFDRGVILLGDSKLRGSLLKQEHLSTQADIVVYKGKPRDKMSGHVIVNYKNALCVIEVKKWLNPKAISKLREVFTSRERRLGRIRQFLVSFRFHDRSRTNRTWFTQEKYNKRHSYCFAGTYHSKNGEGLYPWQEKWWKDFPTSSRYQDQYRRLVEDLKQLSHND